MWGLLETLTELTAMTKPMPETIGQGETVIPWREDFQRPRTRRTLTFDGPQFQAWCDELFPEFADNPGYSVQLGRNSLECRELPLYVPAVGPAGWQRSWLALRLGPDKAPALCGFSTAVRIPQLVDRRQVWMSLTPNEIMTQRSQITRARGRVVMLGLGLGWAARRVLDRSQVSHLTIVEHDPCVLEYIGQRIVAQYGDRVSLVCGDAYEHDYRGYDVALWDVWPFYGAAKNDRRYLRLRDEAAANGVTFVAWGGGC